MLNERRLAVATVTAAFLSTEQAAEQTAILGARCIAMMIEQRIAANLPLNTGSEARSFVVDATFNALKVRAALLNAHLLLADLPASLGVTSYGGDECPPNEPFTSAVLKSVA